jgi:predicted nucleic acid-binding protein
VSPRIACDTNVLASATLSNGPPRWVLDAVDDGRAELVMLDPGRDELGRVLRDKLRLGASRAHAILDDLDELAAQGQPKVSDAMAVTGHRADDEVLACAVDAQVDVLVTGDHRHLIPVGTHQGVRILTPQALLAELAAR